MWNFIRVLKQSIGIEGQYHPPPLLFLYFCENYFLNKWIRWKSSSRPASDLYNNTIFKCHLKWNVRSFSSQIGHIILLAHAHHHAQNDNLESSKFDMVGGYIGPKSGFRREITCNYTSQCKNWVFCDLVESFHAYHVLNISIWLPLLMWVKYYALGTNDKHLSLLRHIFLAAYLFGDKKDGQKRLKFFGRLEISNLLFSIIIIDEWPKFRPTRNWADFFLPIRLQHSNFSELCS